MLSELYKGLKVGYNWELIWNRVQCDKLPFTGSHEQDVTMTSRPGFSCCLWDKQSLPAEQRRVHPDWPGVGPLLSSGSRAAPCTGSAGRPPAPGHWMDWDGNWTVTMSGTLTLVSSGTPAAAAGSRRLGRQRREQPWQQTDTHPGCSGWRSSGRPPP